MQKAEPSTPLTSRILLQGRGGCRWQAKALAAARALAVRAAEAKAEAERAAREAAEAEEAAILEAEQAFRCHPAERIRADQRRSCRRQCIGSSSCQSQGRRATVTRWLKGRRRLGMATPARCRCFAAYKAEDLCTCSGAEPPCLDDEAAAAAAVGGSGGGRSSGTGVTMGTAGGTATRLRHLASSIATSRSLLQPLSAAAAVGRLDRRFPLGRRPCVAAWQGRHSLWQAVSCTDPGRRAACERSEA